MAANVSPQRRLLWSTHTGTITAAALDAVRSSSQKAAATQQQDLSGISDECYLITVVMTRYLLTLPPIASIASIA